jgi:sugar phosphate isomerase/epimerase
MKIGVTLPNTDIRSNFEWCAENGITTCQVYTPDFIKTPELEIKAALADTGMDITSLIAEGGGGAHVYDFYAGPLTLGIIPVTFRASRIGAIIESGRIAQKLGVRDVCGHMGFVPENPNDPNYNELVQNLRYITAEYKTMGLRINMETGQETPITLWRLINDVGADNLGLNFDPANLLMYGKANPCDALDIVGKYINGVHAKDGEYPTNGRVLGVEKPLGEGRVNFPVFIKKLRAVGYDGALTIEREISGPKQRKDIIHAKDLLLSILEYQTRVD